MDDLTKPEASSGDIIHSVTKIGLSVIPIFGGPAAEIFSAVIAPPLAKRRDKWMCSIVKEFEKLQQKFDGFSIDSLFQDEAFLTVLLNATQIAIRNHEEEKLTMLKNAVMNTALSSDTDDDKKIFFINMSDGFTAHHIRILKFIHDPNSWLKENNYKENIEEMGSIENLRLSANGEPLYGDSDPSLVEEGFKPYLDINIMNYKEQFELIFPGLDSNYYFYDQILIDLKTKGLIHSQSVKAIYLNPESNSGTTDFGKEFVRFITSPIPN